MMKKLLLIIYAFLLASLFLSCAPTNYTQPLKQAATSIAEHLNNARANLADATTSNAKGDKQATVGNISKADNELVAASGDVTKLTVLVTKQDTELNEARKALADEQAKFFSHKQRALGWLFAILGGGAVVVLIISLCLPSVGGLGIISTVLGAIGHVALGIISGGVSLVAHLFIWLKARKATPIVAPVAPIGAITSDGSQVTTDLVSGKVIVGEIP